MLLWPDGVKAERAKVALTLPGSGSEDVCRALCPVQAVRAAFCVLRWAHQRLSGNEAEIVPLDSGCNVASLRVHLVPHWSESPPHKRYGLLLGMVQCSFHWQHLCSDQLVLAIQLFLILQLAWPCSASTGSVCLVGL